MDMLKYMVSIGIPVVYYVAYVVLSYRKSPVELDYKMSRRIYYLYSFIWTAVVVWIFHQDLPTINIINTKSVNSLWLNYSVVLFIFGLYILAWDYLFISCTTIRKIKYKDIEFNLEEQETVRHTDEFQESQIQLLYKILSIRNKMIKYIDEYVKQNNLDPFDSYKNIMMQYSKKRKNLKVLTEIYNQTGLYKIGKVLKLNQRQISSIAYAIELTGFCNFSEFKCNDIIFSKIKTMYVEEDILLVLQSRSLIDKENLILIDIINYFELRVENEILIAENQHLLDETK